MYDSDHYDDSHEENIIAISKGNSSQQPLSLMTTVIHLVKQKMFFIDINH